MYHRGKQTDDLKEKMPKILRRISTKVFLSHLHTMDLKKKILIALKPGMLF